MDVVNDVGADKAVPTTEKLRSRGRTCKDCAAPIAKGARLRCRACAYVARKFGAPADFAEVSDGQIIAELMVIYDVGKNVIQRWRAETGHVAYSRNRPGEGRRRKSATPSAPALVKVRRTTITGLFGSAPRARNDGSRAAGAAQFLQKFGPIYRCNALGKPDFTGPLWRRGSAVLTDDELVERAEDMGWQPDAWRQLAAVNKADRSVHA